MKNKIIGILAGASILAMSAAAVAQTVVITPENETVIREYIVTHEVVPVEAPADFDIVVGAELPETIVVQPLEVPDLETRYEYVVVDDRTVLVEPGSRRIVHILN
jgi:hypothetical protein